MLLLIVLELLNSLFCQGNLWKNRNFLSKNRFSAQNDGDLRSTDFLEIYHDEEIRILIANIGAVRILLSPVNNSAHKFGGDENIKLD